MSYCFLNTCNVQHYVDCLKSIISLKSSHLSHEGGTIIIPILQKRKLRLGEVIYPTSSGW